MFEIIEDSDKNRSLVVNNNENSLTTTVTKLNNYVINNSPKLIYSKYIKIITSTLLLSLFTYILGIITVNFLPLLSHFFIK